MSSVDKLYKDVLIVTRIQRSLLHCITSVENVHLCTFGFCSTGLYLTTTPVWGMFHKKLLGSSRFPFLLPTINVIAVNQVQSADSIYLGKTIHWPQLLIHHLSPKVSGDTQTLLVTNACSDMPVNCFKFFACGFETCISYVCCIMHATLPTCNLMDCNYIISPYSLTPCVRCHVGQS